MTRPPLDGVRILAVSQFGAGPFGTQMLADLGADIIKIEDPGVGGDSARYVPPFQGEADSPYFQSFNRGKRSVSINLRHPDGQAVLHDLVRVSDAVFNNARGDLPDKLGLTYDALQGGQPPHRLLLAHRLRHAPARARPSPPSTTWSRATRATWR